MNRELKIVVSVVVVAVLLLSGFGYYEATQHHGSKGVIITLSSGDNLSSSLTRIVSLDPAATATLYALGAYRYVVGGSQYDSYPSNSTVPVVGEYPSMNLEEIFNLTPQAVISFDSAYSQGQVDKLLNAGINYIFLNAGSGSGIATIEKQDTLLGKLTGTQENATLLNGWINSSLSAISNATSSITGSKELSAFYYESSSGGIYTTGNGTFFNAFFSYSHLKNVASSLRGGFTTVSPETIASNEPQVIFLDQFVNSSALSVYPFNTSPAVKNGRIYTLPNENIFSQPNFRNIYSITWMVGEAYGINVSIPAFPMKVGQSPDPLSAGG